MDRKELDRLCSDRDYYVGQIKELQTNYDSLKAHVESNRTVHLKTVTTSVDSYLPCHEPTFGFPCPFQPVLGKSFLPLIADSIKQLRKKVEEIDARLEGIVEFSGLEEEMWKNWKE